MKFKKDKICILGLVRNAEKTIKNDYKKILKAFGFFKEVNWIIIESDSKDKTLEELKKIKKLDKLFRFHSLGSLEKKYKLRTVRIAYCRNMYLKLLSKEKKIKSNLKYLVIADFDGINSHINRSGVMSCWKKKKWDVCLSNQLNRYYDIWPLRANNWIENDCWQNFKYNLKKNKNYNKAIREEVYSKMIKIKKKSKWIKVNSGFGGLAIYKFHKNLLKLKYSGLTKKGKVISEHVLFNNLLRNKLKYNLYINPKLINSSWNNHTSQLKSNYKNILWQKIKNILINVFVFVFGTNIYFKIKKI